jgi:hypothetical protein
MFLIMKLLKNLIKKAPVVEIGKKKHPIFSWWEQKLLIRRKKKKS